MKKQLKIANDAVLIVALLLLNISFFLPQTSHARDPFLPFSSSNDKKAKDKKSDTKKSEDSKEESSGKRGFSVSNPLTTTPVENYKLAGVMLTPKEAYAVVKAPNGIQYITKKDDRIGNEGGKISEVTIDYITVKNGEDEVKIPVSNYVEAISVEEKEIIAQ